MSPGRAEDVASEDSECALYNLGYVDPDVQHTDLLRHRFPCKLGGRPAWLDPLHLPSRQQLTCSTTGQLMQFLLQIYCPLDVNTADAFHRCLFLFISPKGDQLASPGSVRALRCQLPRVNPFYSHEPPKDTDLYPKPLEGAELSLALERDPWLVAAAEAAAAAGTATAAGGAPEGLPLFKEQEIVVEPEPEEDEDEGAGGQGVQRVMAEYRARVAAEGEYDEEELPSSLVEELEAGQGEDRRTFAEFQARTARAPEQCIRYCSQEGAVPLWPSMQGRPQPQDIPPCPHCGQARRFEFQVMPQLLSFMELDAEDPNAPDWGAIVVYTCPSSCATAMDESGGWPSAYAEEFAWVQPP